MRTAAAKQAEVLDEVAQAAASEGAALSDLLKRTEDTLRRLAAAEAQGRFLRESLEALEARRVEAEGSARELERQRDARRTEAEGAERRRAELEAEVARQTDLAKALVREHDELTLEAESLKARRTRLEESVEALRRAREDYLAKIETLKAQHASLLTK